MRTKLAVGLCVTVGLGGVASAAQPAAPAAAAVFAGRDIVVTGTSTVRGGPVAANGNVTHTGGSLTVESAYAGGAFTRSGAAFQSASGDLLFNGSITGIGGPSSVFAGDVTSGTNVTFLPTSGSVVGGNVTAAGNVDQAFTLSTIHGSVRAGGNVNVQGRVDGNVTYGGSLTTGPFTTVGGATAKGGAVVPPAYVPLTLPAGRNLTPGATNVTVPTFGTAALTPGDYGALSLGSSTSVSLTAGRYVFATITSSSSLNQMRFDTTGGPIDLYVAGNLSFDLVQVINGVALFSGTRPNPDESLKIALEVGGSYTGQSEFYGTVVAPNGDITLGLTGDVTGRVLAGRDVILNTSDVTVVPEPAVAGGLAVVLPGLLARRRRRARAAVGR
jgi:hypothetical protein